MPRRIAVQIHAPEGNLKLGDIAEGEFLKRQGDKIVGGVAGGESGGVAEHEAAPDPHPGYLTSVEADALYEASGAAAGAVTSHEAAADPHPTYLRQVEADALYDIAGAAVAEVAAHAALADPHPVYTTAAEAAAAAPVQSVAGKTGIVSLAKADVGLGNVDNTSDASKPVSTATQTALNAKQATSEKGVANGYASLGADGKVPSSQLPAASSGSPFLFEGVLAGDVSTAANITPVNVTGLVFTFAANKNYVIEIFGTISAAAATTGIGLQFDVSVAVTQVALTFFHQLANTGTLTGGNSIADDASAGVSSGIAANASIVPVYASGVLRSGASTGTAQLRLRSEVAAVSTIKAGTVMRVRELP